ncbi:MAG: class II glutamine amidotransferase [Clostridiales bacterium]|nr:class II glutamine amidotransferase [Clostridiales bacterium]
MCELFAISSTEKINIQKHLEEFFSRGVHHPHGWGLINIDNMSLYREPARSDTSEKLKLILSRPFLSKTALAHIRYATIGDIATDNCHPFVGYSVQGTMISLIHNGTLFDGTYTDCYYKLQKGDTDSERLLMYLIEKINREEFRKAGKLNTEEKISVIEELVLELSKNNKLNLIISDGELLYVHSNFKDTLYYSELEGHTLIATVPLKEGEWQNVPFRKLNVWKEGRLILTGSRTTHEYIEDKEHTKYLYGNYSSL